MESAAPQRGQLVKPRAMGPPHQEQLPPEDGTSATCSDGAGAAYAGGAAGGAALIGGSTGARLTGDPQPGQKFWSSRI